jgi:hypothetical protein
MDAVAIGQRMGFSADSSLTYDASDEGVASAMASATAYVSRRRLAAPAGLVAVGFSEEDRAGARGNRR